MNFLRIDNESPVIIRKIHDSRWPAIASELIMQFPHAREWNNETQTTHGYAKANDCFQLPQVPSQYAGEYQSST